MTKRKLALDKVYGLLEPGPVLLLSTSDGKKHNVMTLTWQTMLEFVPPLVACVVSNRNASFKTLVKSKQGVLNIPSAEMAKTVVAIGNTSGRRIDKFKKFKLTAAAAKKVNAPLIEECFACLEFKVIDTSMVEKYGLFVLQVVAAWREPFKKQPATLHHRGWGEFALDGKVLKLKSQKM